MENTIKKNITMILTKKSTVREQQEREVCSKILNFGWVGWGNFKNIVF